MDIKSWSPQSDQMALLLRWLGAIACIMALYSAKLDARRGNNDIDPGIMEVSRLIDTDLFKIDFNACQNTAREFECYSYAEDDHGKVLRDKPLDKDNHAMDALRYLCASKAKQGHANSTRGFR